MFRQISSDIISRIFKELHLLLIVVIRLMHFRALIKLLKNSSASLRKYRLTKQAVPTDYLSTQLFPVQIGGDSIGFSENFRKPAGMAISELPRDGVERQIRVLDSVQRLCHAD